MKQPKDGQIEIFKLQRPLASNEPNPPMLVYNESRSIYEHLPFTEEFRQMFGSDEKLFFKGRIKVTGKDEGNLDLIEPVEDPGW